MKKKEINRAKSIKLTVLSLFLILIVLWIILSIVFIFAYASYSGIAKGETSKIFTSLPFILYFCAIILVASVILVKIITTINALNDYAVLDSDEINKMIAKSTAPFREKYYLMYNTTKKNDNKLTLLRKHLEKMQIKINKGTKNDQN